MDRAEHGPKECCNSDAKITGALTEHNDEAPAEGTLPPKITENRNHP
jgi:hypothetical protein